LVGSGARMKRLVCLLQQHGRDVAAQPMTANNSKQSAAVGLLSRLSFQPLRRHAAQTLGANWGQMILRPDPKGPDQASDLRVLCSGGRI
jgi:hypothetical protein